MRYVLDGKGSYGPGQSTIYDLTAHFEEHEHKDANYFLFCCKSATVAGGQTISNEKRYVTLMNFLDACQMRLDSAAEFSVDLDQSFMPVVQHKETNLEMAEIVFDIEA
jgi:hypothetical protein